jgi:hypothetical protein
VVADQTPVPLCRFDTFEVETRRGELRPDSLLLNRHQQPAWLLQSLLQHSGERVNPEKCASTCGPPEIYVDFDQDGCYELCSAPV